MLTFWSKSQCRMLHIKHLINLLIHTKYGVKCSVKDNFHFLWKQPYRPIRSTASTKFLCVIKIKFSSYSSHQRDPPTKLHRLSAIRRLLCTCGMKRRSGCWPLLFLPSSTIRTGWSILTHEGSFNTPIGTDVSFQSWKFNTQLLGLFSFLSYLDFLWTFSAQNLQ
jgi:hypothetical protein